MKNSLSSRTVIYLLILGSLLALSHRWNLLHNAIAQTIVAPPNTLYLPVITNDPAPTFTPTPIPTNTPSPTPTVTPTPGPTATLYPLNPVPEFVAIRPYDVPPGYSIEQDEADAENVSLQYAGGWDTWYIGDITGFGSWVRKYWNPDAAMAGYNRMVNGTFGNDFYDRCVWGTRSTPAIPGATTYTAIQCTKNTYERTIYFAVYNNIVLRFEMASPKRAPNTALLCEKLMAQRALGQEEDFTCRSKLDSNSPD